jgi:hypothetical protein
MTREGGGGSHQVSWLCSVELSIEFVYEREIFFVNFCYLPAATVVKERK